MIHKFPHHNPTLPRYLREQELILAYQRRHPVNQEKK